MTLEEENKILRTALDEIINGTMLDEYNHNDNGLVDVGERRPPTQRDLDRWYRIGYLALAKIKCTDKQ